ncbi:MAG: hypothetical protein CVU38_13040 [Chloroflexi bacterium HGW-Chloroflexi-1]|nr:MAG: hypothetical protein CVU38_13040 [Chloroflexi bacterium HGW-Chloroflexi-1]
MHHIERINYSGWPNCYRIANDLVDLVVTTDVGPRIIRFGFVGQSNEFKEFPDMLGQVGGEAWRIYGGHRLWHAPEVVERTYYPDNGPVSLEQHPGFVRVIQPVEPTTGIQKELDIRLAPEGAHVRVIHRLRNYNLWAVTFGPWALSVMAPGGTAVIPLPPRGVHPENLQPVNTLTLWAFTDMSDVRWTWGHKYVLLRQDPASARPQKVGALVTDGWVGYARGGHLFVKRFIPVPDAAYPDFNSTVEVFANADFLEVETLGPLVQLAPGASVEHVEDWRLFDGVSQPIGEADVEAHILPRVVAVGSK